MGFTRTILVDVYSYNFGVHIHSFDRCGLYVAARSYVCSGIHFLGHLWTPWYVDHFESIGILMIIPRTCGI